RCAAPGSARNWNGMIRSAQTGDTMSRISSTPDASSNTRAVAPSEPAAPSRRRWLAFSIVVAASMMDLLDATVAQVAGPVIRDDLGGSLADLQWMTAAYTLAMAVMLLTGGRLGDIFGRRRMLLIGAAGFTLSSLAVAAAPSMELLIAARTLQGAFGAV